MALEVTQIGPSAHGQQMALAEFEQGELQEGWLYELGRGKVVVSDVPGKPHLQLVRELKRQLHGYDVGHPEAIDTLATGSECKLSSSASGK